MSAPARNIILVGFMGTGKSSLARILARKIGCPLVDTDTAIEKKAGQPISAIFAESGENAFREIETEVLRAHLDKSGCIISTGGGMVIREENRQLLPQIGLVVWLHASEAVIYERVSRNNRRPLLQTADPRGTLHELLVLREPWYREVAQLEINTGRVNRGEAVSLILEAAGWTCKPA